MLIRWGVLDLMDNQSVLAVIGLNVVGSVLIGLLAGRGLQDQPSWTLGALGFCGGLTTFSTFALDTARHLNNGNVASALGLVATTVVLATIAAGIGYRLGERSRSGRQPKPWLNLGTEDQAGWTEP